jgi:hypothetical protein
LIDSSSTSTRTAIAPPTPSPANALTDVLVKDNANQPVLIAWHLIIISFIIVIACSVAGYILFKAANDVDPNSGAPLVLLIRICFFAQHPNRTN